MFALLVLVLVVVSFTMTWFFCGLVLDNDILTFSFYDSITLFDSDADTGITYC